MEMFSFPKKLFSVEVTTGDLLRSRTNAFASFLEKKKNTHFGTHREVVKKQSVMGGLWD
jgi:hypothetical protein